MSKHTVFSDGLKKHGLDSVEPPSTLFHYTTAGGFAGIVESRNIRATNFSFMNDPSEVVHGRDLIQSLLQEARQKHPQPRVDELYRRTIVELNKEGASEIYVSCFTAKKDDLSQWRAYGGSSARYALEFDTKKLIEATLRPHSYKVRFSEVVYNQQQQHEAVSDVLEAAANMVRDLALEEADLDDCAGILFRRLARMLPRLKAQPYDVEAEWRIILLVRADDTKKVKFDTSKGVIRSYIDFPLTADRLPLKSVFVLAPSRPKAAEKAARLVLNKAGLEEAKVQYSTIPVADV